MEWREDTKAQPKESESYSEKNLHTVKWTR